MFAFILTTEDHQVFCESCINFTTANQEEAENWLRKMREFSEFGESTNQAFEMLAAVMDEIESRYNK